MIKDSGDRTEFSTGAVRDIRVGKGRCDLLPLDVVCDIYEYYKYDVEPLRYIDEFIQTGEYINLVRAIGEYIELTDIENISDMLLKLSVHFENGALKYGEDNWKKGIPVNIYIDSGVRHYLKYLRKDDDEPHYLSFIWNIMCAIWTCKNMPELNQYINFKISDI